jgi:FADH2 O2-dependent halogenase
MENIHGDVVVLGSSFGGSITALMLDSIGLTPVVLDKASHPRFTIGESSTPTGNMILRDLANRYNLSALRSLSAHGPWQETYPDVTGGRKRGFSYFRHPRGESFMPALDHSNELLVAASSDPYHSDTQWLRADVDALLAEKVREADIPLLENTTVVDVDRGDRWRIQATRNGTPIESTADFIVDATGKAQVLSSLGITDADVSLQTHSRALFGHFRGLPRWRDWMDANGARTDDYPFPCDEAVVHHVLDDGWLWEIRFDDGRVSAGLVLDAETRPCSSSQTPLEEWRARLQPYPTLAHRFDEGQTVDPPGQIVRTGRLQRLVDPAAGPGWALLPSAAGFVDPLHSTGIAHTLSGIERLGRLFERYDTTVPRSALRTYSGALHREFHCIDRLVRLCYDSLPSFRAWTVSTMFYFAAATTYERRRAHVEQSLAGPPSFLCAEDVSFWDGVRRAFRVVPNENAPSDRTLNAYEEQVRNSIRPFNDVGLLAPRTTNMYPHAAAPQTDDPMLS